MDKALYKLTKKDLKIIAKKIANIDLHFLNHYKTKLVNRKRINYINLDLAELNNQSEVNKRNRGHKVKEFALMVLLHEIGHYKQFLRFKNVDRYMDYYSRNQVKLEVLADRFARRYYKKVLKSYNLLKNNKL